jgi:hypothetical protein
MLNGNGLQKSERVPKEESIKSSERNEYAGAALAAEASTAARRAAHGAVVLASANTRHA